MIMVILLICSGLGVAAMRLSLLGERSARADRDTQVAFQSAEAALLDAEFDIYGPDVPSDRRTTFGAHPDLGAFVENCGSSGNSAGLCAMSLAGKPAWLTVDFISSSAALIGQFTHRTFASGIGGVSPALKPRYVIEPMRDPGDRDLGGGEPKYVYRVTAMGVGPREETQAVVQMIYRP